MPEKKKYKLSKGAKIAIGAITIVITLLLAVQAYASYSGNKDMDIYNGIQDQLEEIANGPDGCCLPQCGEGKEIECDQTAGTSWVEGSCSSLGDTCKIGCCYPYGDLAKASCEFMGSSDWYAGTCKKGYTGSASMVDSGSFGGDTSGVWDFTMDASTCDEDPYNATWTSSWEWNWVATLPDGHTVPAKDSGSPTFTTDGGSSAVMIGESPGTVTVTSDTIDVVFDMGELGDISASGTIKLGNPECENPKDVGL